VRGGERSRESEYGGGVKQIGIKFSLGQKCRDWTCSVWESDINFKEGSL